MPKLETDQGITLSYSYHTGEKPDTIILLHGLGASKKVFRKITGYTKLAGYNILTMDHVGHGDSSSPHDFSYSMREMAEHVKRLVDEKTQSGNVFLVLHSMGGAIGIFLAEMLGDRVKGIVFAEGNIDFDDCFFSNYIISRHSLEEWESEKFNRILGKYKASSKMEIYAESFEKAGALTLYRASEDLVKISKNDVLLGKLVALGVPVIGVYGDENKGKYPSEARFREHFPVVFTPDSGHNMMEDNPDEFYLEISEFIESL